MKAQRTVVFAWGLSVLVCILAVWGWMPSYGLFIDDFNNYQLFPLFGLLAFSLMWTHYVIGALRRMLGIEKQPLKKYFAVTGWLAFIFILLHPSLLIYQLWSDGDGLPPNSYLDYVGPSLKWAVMLGTLSFLIFLSFETKKWFSNKGWWPIIEYANVVAMFAIIAHSLALGSDLVRGWYRAVWLSYAVILMVSVGYTYYCQVKQAKRAGNYMKKVIAISVVVALIAGIGTFAYMQMNKVDESANTITTSTEDQALEIETADQEVFTVEEVADHNSEQDCWTIVSGSVYDITSYIPRHPGGDEILRACGEDGTSLFTTRTDSSGNAVGSGEPHSSSAQSQLESFKVGTVSQ